MENATPICFQKANRTTEDAAWANFGQFLSNFSSLFFLHFAIELNFCRIETIIRFFNYFAKSNAIKGFWIFSIKAKSGSKEMDFQSRLGILIFHAQQSRAVMTCVGWSEELQKFFLLCNCRLSCLWIALPELSKKEMTFCAKLAILCIQAKFISLGCVCGICSKCHTWSYHNEKRNVLSPFVWVADVCCREVINIIRRNIHSCIHCFVIYFFRIPKVYSFLILNFKTAWFWDDM